MKSRFPGRCACCSEPFAKGAEITYLAEEKAAYLPGHEPGARTEEEDEALADRLGFE